ncbi:MULTISPECIES: hypothetical protein [unclassified Streptomyces]|uniref:hypothetical protein n=1 Tax=unclassified Streptomyces TaxID=2593676 RepID=UPI001F04E5D9|nr:MULTISPECIES: hypothetical protein [unclassified Streptomyces]MCH0565970.1 hypothetical protein [Streptomyces sp. MUM 2J]MCH0569135.1 hypothetical protein [Streptomyces sp. MUM 136J]
MSGGATATAPRTPDHAWRALTGPVEEGTPYGTALDDAVHSAAAVGATARSAAQGTWVSLGP